MTRLQAVGQLRHVLAGEIVVAEDVGTEVAAVLPAD